jgi:hypothetical protein
LSVGAARERRESWGQAISRGDTELVTPDLAQFDPTRHSRGVAVVIEMSPTQVLPRPVQNSEPHSVRVVTVGTGAEGHPDLLAVLAAAWVCGVDSDLSMGLGGRRLRLPAYAFQRSVKLQAVSYEADGSSPLTPHQQRLLFQDLVRRTGTSEQTVAAVTTFDDEVHVDALCAALADIQEARPELRTTFLRSPLRWQAAVRAQPAALVDARTVPPRTPEEVLSTLHAEVFTPGDAEMFRTTLLSRTGGGFVLGISAHRALAPDLDIEALLAAVVIGYESRVHATTSALPAAKECDLA